MRLNQRRNSPERDHRKHQRNTNCKPQASQQLPISRIDDYRSDGHQRCPRDWAFGKKTERERKIENPPPRKCSVFGVDSVIEEKFVSSPIRQGHEQHEPHVGDRGFSVNEGLERKREDNCSPPADLFSSQPPTPAED